MNINIHTHLFTLRNVLSKEAVRAIGNRLRHKKIPEHFVQGIENFISGLSTKPHYLDEDQLLEELVKSILDSPVFKDFAQNHLYDIPALNAINIDSQKLSQVALKQILNSLSAWGSANDDSKSTLFDIYETLRIALKPHTTAIADHLLEHLSPDDALVGLMMDIRGDTELARDKQRFNEQQNDLMEAALQRPGRVFPFFAVNPKRPDHFELMKDALENKGFVGIKLYPSLGYKVTHPKLMDLYAYCEEHDTPLLMHCNHSGFYVEEAFIEYCNPDHWTPILDQHPGLKLCFAHFDGHESLSLPGGLQGDTWGKKILEMMEHDTYTGIYADISYHTDMMHEPGLEEHYLKTLKELMDRPIVQDRILFGTDSWLLRLNMSDELFWSYFRGKLSKKHFHRMASSNAKAFLGIEPRKENIERFIGFHKKHSGNVGAHPNKWLLEEADAEFSVKRDNPNWTVQRYPALVVGAAIGSQFYSRQKELAFTRRAFITMQELKFWKLSYADRDAFDQECRKLSLDLVNQCEKVNGKKEGDWTKNEVRQTFEAMIRRGSTRLFDLAIQIESMYNFDYGSG